MPKYYYHGWTTSEEQELAEIMVNGLADRKKMRELFKLAAEQLKRSPYSCQNRWYEIKGRFTGQSKVV